MKNLILCFLLTLPFSAFSQNDISVETYKMHGYVNGVKLDTVESKYASVWFLRRYTYFDYNQKVERQAEKRLCDETGNYLIFNSRTSLLNFLDYNGWEVVQYYNSYAENWEYLLKKKN